jgi:hypothetical protein
VEKGKHSNMILDCSPKKGNEKNTEFNLKKRVPGITEVMYMGNKFIDGSYLADESKMEAMCKMD